MDKELYSRRDMGKMKHIADNKKNRADKRKNR